MRRNGFKVMAGLIGLIKPLMGYMVLACFLGVLGFLAAIGIPVIGAAGLLAAANEFRGITVAACITMMILFAVFRGILRYGEQACNHFIAFKLLALIRHKVFEKLRELAPAKLDGKDKGNLISMITSDIELLEVFYAHTISPIIIATIVSAIMTALLAAIHPVLAVIGATGYLIIGVIIPVIWYKKGDQTGYEYRDGFGKLNSYFLDSLRGFSEILQFGHQDKRLLEITKRTNQMEHMNRDLKKKEGSNRAVTDTAVLTISTCMLLASVMLYQNGGISFAGAVLAFVMIISSFGPVIALSNLANNLYHTLASGNRVLDLLEESPVITDISGKQTAINEGTIDVKADHVTFAYGKEVILSDVSLDIPKGTIVGIHGKSGSGKSTLLKLMMRFYSANDGTISLNNTSVENINTSELRENEAYVTQDTILFNDTIEANIKVGKLDATREEVISAAKKAAIHDFIVSLPQGYDTIAGELGGHLSGGEKQRIGVARAFLHDANLILLDEPTSNLDSLNESIILDSIAKESKDKTFVLVSHRKSTMNIADHVYAMKEGRAS